MEPAKENIPNETLIRETLGIAMGQASMCWSEVPKGQYDSERASKILKDVMDRLMEIGSDS
jgi:hypothetical protein